jgi:hypothetical protein
MARVKNAGRKAKQGNTKTETRTQQPRTPEEQLNELVQRIRENATAQDRFIQVSSDLKKVGPGLSLTGLERVYKQPEKSDFVYSLEHRVAGPSTALDQILGKLGASLAGQRLKNDIVDLTNYSSHLVVRPPVQREPLPELKLYSSTDISDLARRIKESRVAAKEEKANASPKKKRALRRKSPTGVQVARTPRVTVDRLLATSESLAETLRRLAEKQQGLDLTSVTFEESPEGLMMVGGRAFRVKHKSSRVLVQHGSGHLTATTVELFEQAVRRLGLSDADTLVQNFRSQSETPAEKKVAPKAQKVKEEVVEKTQAKPKAATKAAPKAQKASEAQPKGKQAKATKKAERQSPKVTKAKTRAVKPRTSHE